MKCLLIFLLQLSFFYCFSQNDTILVTEQTLKVSGLWTEELYYGFAKGDQLILNCKVVNGKPIKEVEVMAYPSSSKFKGYEVERLSDKVINVDKEGIYQFNFYNASLGKRVINLTIKRVPASQELIAFNTAVEWRTIYDTTYTLSQEEFLREEKYTAKSLHSQQEFYINSGSNATFKGGNSRISIPITLPPNTVEWYYTFSASRKKEEIEAVRSNMNLVSELTKLIDQSGALGFGVKMLVPPPGSDYCELYLLDRENERNFLNKVGYRSYGEGSRINFKSGVVQVSALNQGTYYLGIKNPDSMHGIHVVVEVVAILKEQIWDTREIKTPHVSFRKEPFLEN